ncbi:MAG: choice-of-anchor D domain-containing protein [Terracidiphilus sp.]
MAFPVGAAAQTAVFSYAQRTLSSSFHDPYGVAVDASGNVYVGGTGNNSVEEMLAVNGTVPPSPTINSSFSGSFTPTGIAVDGSGNIFVDFYNSSSASGVYKIPSGCTSMSCVTTIGGGFDYPYGVAVDKSDNVYVADQYNTVIYKIPSGCTSAGCIASLGGGLNTPMAVAVDGNGNVFVAQWGTSPVEEIPASCIAGANNASCTVALGSGFFDAKGIAVDASGNVYVANYGNGTVQEMLAVNGSIPTSSPTINTVGSGFVEPQGVAVDSHGNVYVADGQSDDVVELQTGVMNFGTATVASASTDVTMTVVFAVSGYSGTFTPTVVAHYGKDYSVGAVSCTTTSGGENCSVPVTFQPTLPGGRKDALFVTDGSTRLASELMGGIGEAPLALVQPGVVTNINPGATYYQYDSTVDENGTVYVVSSNSNAVYSVTKTGVVTELPLTGIQGPSGIAIDGAGELYIAQNTYSKVLVTYDTVTGTQGTLCVAPPAGGSACTTSVNNDYLISVAVDQLGNVFATDIEYTPISVVELTPAGNYTTTAISPAITQPYQIAVDSSDDVFVGGYAINEIPISGTQTQVNTTGASEGIAVDPADTLYATRYSVPPYDVAMLPASNYATPLAGIDGGVSGEIESPLGLGLGSDGTLYVGNYTDLDKVDRTQGAIAFGEQNVNVESTAEAVGIYNGGNQNLTLSNLAVSGTGFAMQPAATNGCTASLVIAPGQLCEVDVTATFPNAGTFSGTITFTTNSLNTTSTTQTVNLSGFVYGPYVTTAQSAAFGNQNVGTNPTMTVTLTNNGDLYSAGLGFGTATVPAGFTISAGTGTGSCGAAGDSLAPGASCAVTVTFSPTAAIPYGGTVSIPVSSNGGGGPWPAATFAVSGTGVAVVPVAGLAPNPVTFTGQVAGTTSTAAVVTLSNTGGASLTGITPTITGTNPGDFAITTGTNACGSTLAIGDICNIYVTFTPASAASFTATLSVADNASNTPQTVTLNGTGVSFVSNVGTAETAQSVTVNITKAGTLNSFQVLTQGVANLDFTYAPGGSCTTDTAYTVGETCTVNVTFNPEFAGARNGAILLTDAGGNVLGTTYLPGTGTGPQIVYGPSTAVTTSLLPSSTYTIIGVAVDGGGNVYFSDTVGGQILKLPKTGSGYGTAIVLQSGLNQPFGVAVDGAGNVFVGGYANHEVLEIPWNGVSYGTAVTLNLGATTREPRGISVDGQGNVYFADYAQDVAVEIPLTASGYGTPVVLPFTGLSSLNDVKADPNGDVFVANTYAHSILELPRSGSGFGAQVTVAANIQGGVGQPQGIALDSYGNIYVADAHIGTGTNNVYEIPYTGSSYGAPVNIPITGVTDPYEVAVDGAGNLYEADGIGEQGFKLGLAVAPSLSFAATNVGSISSDSPKTVMVTNVGNVSLYLNAAANNPLYPEDFPINNNDTNLCEEDNVVDVGKSCDVSINFKPTTTGLLSEDVVLTDNNLNGNGVTQSIPVSGTGQSSLIAQTITFTQPTTPVTYSAGLQISLVATGGASGNPVVFSIDASSTGAGSISGSTLTVTSVGSFVIDANQAGNSTYSAAPQVQRTVVVTQASQTINFTQPTTPVTYSGTSVNVSLSATGGASGNPVVFAIDSSSTATGSITGSTLTITSTGNLVIDANQAGNTNYSAALPVQRTIVVNALIAQAINFTQPATPETYASGLTISLVATGGASGNPIVFTLDAGSTGAGSISGSTLTVTSLGSFVIDANQAGNSTYSAAPQVQRTVVVTQAPQTINFTQPTSPITYSSGLQITLSATGGASGNPVVFTIDASSTATGSISGSTLTVTSTGNLVIDANQAGNADYSAAPQVQKTVTVNAPAPDFAVAATLPSQSIEPGGSAMYPITVTDVGSSFTSAVALSVSGLPPGATASFNPATITPDSASGTSTLTVTTANVAGLAKPNLWPVGAPALALLFMLPFSRWRRAWKGKVLLLIAALASLAGAASLMGCGGGFGLNVSETYTLTITGTSGTDMHSTTVQLTVK